MTPEQARFVVRILTRERAYSVEEIAALEAAQNHLMQHAAPQLLCIFRVEGQDLIAADPGGEPRRIMNASCFAPLACMALKKPGQPMQAHGTANQLKTRRRTLVQCLMRMRRPVLAAAVREIEIRKRDGRMFVTYNPEGVPLRLEK